MHQPGALVSLEADVGAARLKIAASAAAGDFPVGTGSRQPDLQVIGASGGEAQIGAAQFDAAVGKVQGFEHRFGVEGELLVGRVGVFGEAEPVELHLVELVQADQAAGVSAVGAGFPPETGGVGRVAQRQLVGRDHLIAVEGGDRDFGGRREPEIVFGAAKALLGEFRQLAGAGEAGAVHQDRRQQFGVAPLGMQVEHQGDQRPLQAGAHASQGHEAALGNAHRAFAVHQGQPLGDLPVLLKLFCRACKSRLTPALHLNVVGLRTAVRTQFGGQVRQSEQLFAQLGLQRLLLVFKAGHLQFDLIPLVPEGLDLGLLGAGTGLDPLSHLLADAVAFSLEVAALFFQLPLLQSALLQAGEIELQTAAGQLSADPLGVVAQ